MPRPCKKRRICAEPSCGCFGPRGTDNPTRPVVRMTLDEFESIRLIDWEGLTQEQCAVRMDVARTTAQAIYGSARQKLAEFLIKEAELVIEGGNYVVCGGGIPECGRVCPRCQRENIRRHAAAVQGADTENPVNGREENKMKIAVTYEDGQVFQHFGHTEKFMVYEVQEGRISEKTLLDTNGNGHGALAGFLAENGVEVLICGGIGGGAQMALQEAGIRFYGGVSGSADEAVQAFLGGTLGYDPDVHCDHHGEGHEGHHGGECGGHHAGGCGHHSCGH